MKKLNFGKCPYCNGELRPIWFIEEETVVRSGHLMKTGRKRQAVSHLICEDCLKQQIVDNSFDGEWYY